jgi:hypothetical protein
MFKIHRTDNPLSFKRPVMKTSNPHASKGIEVQQARVIICRRGCVFFTIPTVGHRHAELRRCSQVNISRQFDPQQASSSSAAAKILTFDLLMQARRTIFSDNNSCDMKDTLASPITESRRHTVSGKLQLFLQPFAARRSFH